MNVSVRVRASESVRASVSECERVRASESKRACVCVWDDAV